MKVGGRVGCGRLVEDGMTDDRDLVGVRKWKRGGAIDCDLTALGRRYGGFEGVGENDGERGGEGEEDIRRGS